VFSISMFPELLEADPSSTSSVIPCFLPFSL
jgi:hypothetical protein